MEKNLKEFNEIREKFIGNLDYIKTYDEARGLHHKTIDSLYKIYLKHKDDIKLFDANKEQLSKVVEVKQIDLTDRDNNNFFIKTNLFLGKYKHRRLIDYVIEKGTDQVKLLKMFKAVKKSFYSIFEVVSAEPPLALIVVKDVIRGGEYCVVDRGLSVYANIDEFKNNYFICSQLTTYEDVSFFDNTLLVEKNNQKVKNYFDKIDSGVSEVQVAFFCFLNQTTELKLAKGER